MAEIEITKRTIDERRVGNRKLRWQPPNYEVRSGSQETEVRSKKKLGKAELPNEL